MANVINFFREAKVELSRVNWPTRKELTRYTILVIAISIAMALFLGGLDFIFSYLVEQLLLS